jgi:hypothetical protein
MIESETNHTSSIPARPTWALSYSPRRGVTRRIRISVIVISILMVATFVASQFGPRALLRFRAVYWQQKISQHLFPEDRVIFSSYGREVISGALADDLQYSAVDSEFSRSYIELQTPDALTRFGQLFGRRFPAGIAFMHARESLNGTHYIVVAGRPSVDGWIWSYTWKRFGLTDEITLQPVVTTILGSPNQYSGWKARVIGGRGHAEKQFRVLAGRLDPADSSKFIIPYELDGKSGVIEGSVLDDGNVTYQIRSRP